MPLFPGCDPALPYEEREPCADRKMLEHIYGNIRYPQHARTYDVEGLAVVSFIIEEDGSVEDIKVVRGLDADIAAEIVRMVKTMPLWEPGRVDEEAVRVQFNLPVRFKLT